MNEYVTAFQLKDYCGIKDDEGSVREPVDKDERLIRRFCEQASRAIDTWTRRTFYPRLETRYYDHNESLRLWLDDDLLAVTALATQNGGDTIAPADYILVPYNAYPKYRIDIDTSSGEVFSISDTAQRSERVTGTWGYHSDWTNAWVDSGDTLAVAVTSTTATSLTVASTVGQDVWGRAPRFQIGHLLKIEDEYLYVYDIPAPTTLYVRRGVNGTEAATHLISTSINTFAPESDITLALLLYGRFLYRQKDSGVTEVTAFPEMGIVQTPAGLPKDVKDIVSKFTRRPIR